MDDPGKIPLLAAPFWFLRHGETGHNVRGLVAGSTDVALTERGQLQAHAAARALEPIGITAIYSSALCRAIIMRLPSATRWWVMSPPA